MKAIDIRGEVEFERILDSLAARANDAAIHFRLLMDLDGSRKEYYREMSVSNTFWHLTFVAHQHAVISRLCLMYDNNKRALGLGKFLTTVKNRPSLFSEEAFRKRLRENPHVESLAKSRELDFAELEEELQAVADSDPLVRRFEGSSRRVHRTFQR